MCSWDRPTPASGRSNEEEARTVPDTAPCACEDARADDRWRTADALDVADDEDADTGNALVIRRAADVVRPNGDAGERGMRGDAPTRAPFTGTMSRSRRTREWTRQPRTRSRTHGTASPR